MVQEARHEPAARFLRWEGLEFSRGHRRGINPGGLPLLLPCHQEGIRPGINNEDQFRQQVARHQW